MYADFPPKKRRGTGLDGLENGLSPPTMVLYVKNYGAVPTFDAITARQAK